MANIYRTLEGDEVRFVRIQPGAWTDPIQCELVYLPLPNTEVDVVEAWFSGKPLPRLLHQELYDPRCLGTTETSEEESTATAPTPFVAISYVWGDSNQTGELLLDGQPVQKTANLIAGLRRLRALLEDPSDTPAIIHHKSTLFWVDALCINQSDDAEKSAQVPRMGMIYGTAGLVVAWLGENGEDDRDVQDLMNLIDSVSPDNVTRSSRTYSCTIDNLDKTRLSRIRHGFESLSERPWFERTWVVQEMLMSHCTILLAGSHWCYLRFFLDAWNAMLEILMKCPMIDEGLGLWRISQPGFHVSVAAVLQDDIKAIFAQKSIAVSRRPTATSQNEKDGCDRQSDCYIKKRSPEPGPRSSIFEDWAHEAASLHENLAVAKAHICARLLAFLLKAALLNMASGYKATVPHDYLYGILSIGGTSIYPKELAPNYALRYEDVFHQYSKLILEYTGDLAIIPRMQHKLAGVPSWVPDFRVALAIPASTNVSPSSIKPDVTISEDGRVCFTKGVYLGEAVLALDWIHIIESKHEHAAVINHFHKFLERCCRERQLDKDHVLKTVLGAFCVNACFRGFQASKVREVYAECVSESPLTLFPKQNSLIEWYSMMSCSTGDTGDTSDTSQRIVLTELLSKFTKSLYFVTSRGSILRLIRYDEQPRKGDVLAMLNGAEKPWLLRHAAGPDKEEYTLVGACEMLYRNTQHSGLAKRDRNHEDSSRTAEIKRQSFAHNEVREFRLV